MANRERLRWYDLSSPATRFAEGAGLVDAEWFRSEVPRSRMRELMARSDSPAIRDTVIWIGLAILAAAAGVWLYPSWWCAPCFLVYGVLYGSASDSRWHETGHGTAFRSAWLDTAVYQVACFCTTRNPVTWRWSHARHHSDTLIVGRDPEIDVMRPARLAKILLNFVGLIDAPVALGLSLVHATGRLTSAEREVVPETERPKAYRAARVWLVVNAATILSAVLLRSWLPVILVGGPRFYGTFMERLYSLTQHAGMGENVLDHRLNSRTVLMSPVNRFIYWNMGYHIEHHMFPAVPYHRLPELHEQLKSDLPAPYPSLWAAYKEIVPAVVRQLRDPTYYIHRELPPGAPPYRAPVDGLFPAALPA